MPDLNDDNNLDALLRGHFAAELDGQHKRLADELDRAPVAFARSGRRSPWRARQIFWAVVPLAMAATLAAVFLLPALMNGVKVNPSPGPAIAQNTPDNAALEHEIQWNTVDQGTVFVNDNVPMRSIRRERLDNVRWFDPSSNATMEMSVPHSETVLVGLNAN